MKVKRLIAIIAVLAVLAFATFTPSRARADTTQIFIIAGIGLAAYIGVIVIATSIVYGAPNKLMLTPADVDVRRDAPEPAVKFGQHCRQTSPALTLFCW
jgi:hypothetical protein